MRARLCGAGCRVTCPPLPLIPVWFPGWKKADEALRHIGTNAIPILLQMIRAKDPPPVMLKLLHMLRRQRLVKSATDMRTSGMRKPNTPFRSWARPPQARCLGS